MNQLTASFEKINIRQPGAVSLTPIKQLIENGELFSQLEQQFPRISENGSVQFIPELRGTNPFLLKEVTQQSVVQKHGNQIAGSEHEIKVIENIFLYLTKYKIRFFNTSTFIYLSVHDI